jgi:hypothetical protein
MKAFMGRFGVPSALRDWAIRELAKAEPSFSSVGGKVIVSEKLSGEALETDHWSEMT